MRYYHLKLRQPSGRTIIVCLAAESARQAQREANLAYAPRWRVVDIIPKECRP